MTAQYSMVGENDQRVVTAFVDGQLLTTDAATNPNFDRIMERLFEDDTAGLSELFTAEKAVERKFKKVSERVSVSNGKVYFDNDPIEDTLSDHLLRLIHSGDDVVYLINFWENIAANPSDHSRENLLRWLEAEDFSITREGMIVGYKGLDHEYRSIHSGPAIVDGVQQNGKIHNVEGSVIELPRSSVTADSFAACAYGLHVGTDSYARSFGYTTVEVYVNPRDVVSVPVDCNGQKMRVCRYTVGPVSEAKHDSPIVSYDEVDNDWDVDTADSEWDLIGY